MDYVIVFDLNETLVRRFRGGELMEGGTKIGPHIVYPQPYLIDLVDFVNNNKFKISLWSSVLLKNLVPVEKHLFEAYGLQFDAIFSQEDCDVGELIGNIKSTKSKKDLRKVASHFKVPLEKCLLIDDSIGKRVENQNFYRITEETDGLKGALRYISEFIQQGMLTNQITNSNTV